MGNYNYYPEELDPYQVLKIPYNASHDQTKNAFKAQLVNTNKPFTCLAYDMICNKNNYFQTYINIYRVKNKDQFYYAHVGGFYELKSIIDENPPLINQKDNLGRTLLYLAARNGYFNICKYLLRKGAKVNEKQNTGSTPLHGASFYGNELVVKLLLQYGAQTDIKNIYSNYPENESSTSLIKDNILMFKGDIINILYNNLEERSLSNGMKILKKKEIVVGKKILRNKNLKGMSYIKDDWILCWHGTQYNALESIMEYGLLVPGMKLKTGVDLEPKNNHIGRYQPVDEFNDWAKAIFVSPSILYALDPCYSGTIDSEGEKWNILVETKVKPNSYYPHISTVNGYQRSKNEPENIEYRIQSSEDVIVTSIVFVRGSYIANNRNYLELTSSFKNFK